MGAIEGGYGMLYNYNQLHRWKKAWEIDRQTGLILPNDNLFYQHWRGGGWRRTPKNNGPCSQFCNRQIYFNFVIFLNDRMFESSPCNRGMNFVVIFFVYISLTKFHSSLAYYYSAYFK